MAGAKEGDCCGPSRSGKLGGRAVLNCIYFNSRSLSNKIANFDFLLNSNKNDLILITETWLKKNLADSLICPANYDIFRCDRPSKGGGVALLTKKQFPLLPVETARTKHFEILCLDLIISLDDKIRFILVYFPPKSASNADSIERLCNELFVLCSTDLKVILIGDFNFPGINWSDLTGKSSADNLFLDFILETKLFQLIEFPTRGKNLLDLILTNDKSLFGNITNEAPFMSSDHCSICFSINYRMHITESKTFLDFFHADYNNMNVYFANVNWGEIFYNLDDIDSIYKAFLLVVQNAISLFVPYRNRSPHKLQYPKHIANLMEYRSKLWKSIQYPTVLAKFQGTTRHLSNEIVKFHRYIERKKFLSQGTAFFNYIGKKIKPNHTKIPLIRDNERLVYSNIRKCELFANHFSSVLGKISSADLYFNPLLPNSFLSNIFVSDTDIYEALTKRKNKINTTPDLIPEILLKNCAVSLAYPIACVCRLSLSKGTVPSSWKTATVIPLFKKDNPSLISNYRPISLTSSISKIIENFVKNKLIAFFNENNIIPSYQHGFCNDKGVVTQMLEAVDDWSLALERKNCIDVVYFDIKSAFDAINHERLLSKLYHWYSRTIVAVDKKFPC